MTTEKRGEGNVRMDFQHPGTYFADFATIATVTANLSLPAAQMHPTGLQRELSRRFQTGYSVT